MRKKIRSIHIILFVMLFLVGGFIDISTIHAEAREKQAKQLFAFAKKNDISGLMQETDSSGCTSFTYSSRFPVSHNIFLPFIFPTKLLLDLISSNDIVFLH